MPRVHVGCTTHGTLCADGSCFCCASWPRQHPGPPLGSCVALVARSTSLSPASSPARTRFSPAGVDWRPAPACRGTCALRITGLSFEASRVHLYYLGSPPLRNHLLVCPVCVCCLVYTFICRINRYLIIPQSNKECRSLYKVQECTLHVYSRQPWAMLHVCCHTETQTPTC